jgi:hypothetical protein
VHTIAEAWKSFDATALLDAVVMHDVQQQILSCKGEKTLLHSMHWVNDREMRLRDGIAGIPIGRVWANFKSDGIFKDENEETQTVCDTFFYEGQPTRQKGRF